MTSCQNENCPGRDECARQLCKSYNGPTLSINSLPFASYKCELLGSLIVNLLSTPNEELCDGLDAAIPDSRD